VVDRIYGVNSSSKSPSCGWCQLANTWAFGVLRAKRFGAYGDLKENPRQLLVHRPVPPGGANEPMSKTVFKTRPGLTFVRSAVLDGGSGFVAGGRIDLACPM